MKTKITLITMVFAMFTIAHFYAFQMHDAQILQKGWLSEATEYVNTVWKCEISDCQTDEDVYAQLAGDH